jgi:hypothetical protein
VTARHLRFSANGVTAQRLGEVTSEARNGAGNPVLYDVGFSTNLRHNSWGQPFYLLICTSIDLTPSVK